MPIKKITDPIYFTDIHFIFDTPKNKALTYMNKLGWSPVDLDRRWTNAGCMYGESGEYFIIIPDLPDKKRTWDISSIIAHEALHVTSRVLRGKGLRLCDESEEAFTYYQSWILQSLLDIYHSHKKGKK